MNLKEFAALKPGDKIANHMANSTGEVVGIDKNGVHVRWLDSGRRPDDGAIAFSVVRHYSVQSTIWTHWSTAETEGA